MNGDMPHYRRTNGALADCRSCSGNGWLDCSEIGAPDVRCHCVNAVEPPARMPPRRAIVARVLLWGLYKRALDGAYVYESWLWGAYRRVSAVWTQPAPLRMNVETRNAFNAIGGELAPAGPGTVQRAGFRTITGLEPSPTTTVPGPGKLRVW